MLEDNQKVRFIIGDDIGNKNASLYDNKCLIIDTTGGIYLGNSNTIATKLADVTNFVINVKYNDLVEMRKNSNLIPGQKYRITNYLTSTTQAKTQSANHQFDIIVTAISDNKLLEEASAINNDSDTYFLNSNLLAWKIWYSLDNDKKRFAWADERGTGVIYRMIDEYNNDLPYDFKNIIFENKGHYYYTFSYVDASNYVIEKTVQCGEKMKNNEYYDIVANNEISFYHYADLMDSSIYYKRQQLNGNIFILKDGLIGKKFLMVQSQKIVI